MAAVAAWMACMAGLQAREGTDVSAATQKARVLIEALPFLKRFHAQAMVVKLGGEPIEDATLLDRLVTDLVWLEQVGIRPILVHGGGKSITRACEAAGIQQTFHQGRRVTDPATMRIMAQEVARLNAHLVERLFAAGGAALGLCPPQLPLVRGEAMDPALGLVGRPVAIERELLTRLTSRGVIPVVPPLSIAADGQLLNTNADDIALAVATGIAAEKLVFLSTVPGVLADPKDPASRFSSLTEHQVRDLVAQGVIRDGMIPKVESCLGALRQGVRKIHIIGADQPHALLLEIFTEEGIGTELTMARPGSSPS